MKHKLLPLLMILGLLACTKKEDPKFTFVLTNAMVQVNNDLSDAAIIQVSPAQKTIYIEVPYADKAELAALDVAFVNLPAEVTASPAKSSFNYSNKGTQKVTFTQGSLSESYTISADYTQPSPHFVSVKLNGIDDLGHVDRLHLFIWVNAYISIHTLCTSVHFVPFGKAYSLRTKHQRYRFVRNTAACHRSFSICD